MPINIAGLKQELQTTINGLTSSTKEDILLLSTAVSNLTDDRIVSVATANDLPDLALFAYPSGNVYYVESVSALVISSKERWIGLDGRLLRNDGNPNDYIAYTWGYNSSGQLGIGTGGFGTSSTSPVIPLGNITEWDHISAGTSFTGGISSGVAYTWGNNSSGQLGDNTTTARSSPITVVGGITNWEKISLGSDHSLAKTTDGLIYSWGSNTQGQLASGNTTGRSSPVTIVGGITTWSDLSAGETHNLAVTSAGVLYAWGRNNYGQLGNNNISNTSSPVTVVGGITTWTNISAGSRHSLGVAEGIAYAWGFGQDGRLGINQTFVSRSSPVTVVKAGVTNWSQVSAGQHSLGLTDSGTLYAWGVNNSGELGDNTTTSRATPVLVVGGITNWSQISAGKNPHSIGITTEGIAYGWGAGFQGRTGTGSTISTSSPILVAGGITTWSQVSSGANHSAAISIVPVT
jgi:alpha-tubulin suppressor-like RCC1 family protein